MLNEIHRLAALDRIRLTYHAEHVRMPERGARYEDVKSALVTSTSAVFQDDHQTWLVEGGVDTDGDEMSLGVDVESDVVVVTLF